MSSVIQLLIVFGLIAFVPFSYLRTGKGKPAPFYLRIMSYLGAVAFGSVIATLLFGLKIIGMTWVIFIILISVLLHRSVLVHLVQGKNKSST